ncbi:MAG TPA: hypothetical protein ENO18_03670, partial [Caldithrix sp.]|nr:hypothetical protein [Caldithrix sp.]
MDSDPIKDNKIFELTDILEETSTRNNQEVIVVDGRGYEKNNKPKELQEVINETKNSEKDARLEEEIINRAAEIVEKIAHDLAPEIAERIAREIVPDIAEKIIREEIEKLK